MITAKEALEISNSHIEGHLESIEAAIREASSKGKTSVKLRQEPFASWAHSTHKNETFNSVRDILQKNGFIVKTFWHEKQFVDYGIEISWDYEPKFNNINDKQPDIEGLVVEYHEELGMKLGKVILTNIDEDEPIYLCFTLRDKTFEPKE